MADFEGEMLTVGEAARMLHRSTEQVRRYLREGALPGRRVGGQWVMAAEAVESFARRRPEPTDFLQQLTCADADPDPLRDVIAIAASGGGDIAAGSAAYLQRLAPGS